MHESMAPQAAARSLLIATVNGHNAALAATVLIAVLLIAAGLAIALVGLTRQDDRVDAIHATAEVLKALLPWPARHPRPSQDEGPPPGSGSQDDH